jgi:tetratricopeptide (TPR) repeat protein/uncharacterized protein YegJ (DUF2314 family)
MVQVRCPECGYLQSLSEERFLSISEDFLNCPHCNARVPKQWGPCNSEHVPEEARHKMSAFASRILNGGLIAKEVAHALESLVRRYGPLESSYKALGVGYTKLGDFRKAEEFLKKASEQDSSDVEIEKHILETYIGMERYDDAKATGFRLIESGDAGSDDVARTAFALFNLEETDAANDLLRAYPIIDTDSAAAKQLRRQLTRVAGANFSAKLREKVNLSRFFGDSGKDGLRVLTERARSLFSPGAENSSELVIAERDDAGYGAAYPEVASGNGSQPNMAPRIEYWIYSPQSEIPKWEDVKRSFGKALYSYPDKARAFKLLEGLIASNDLSVKYILRSEAEELFDYPDELIGQNSRNFTPEDIEVLQESQMIVRMELTPSASWGPASLRIMVSFVEGLRDLTRGLVQDAISHTLWGLESWQEFIRKPSQDVLADHLHLDVLDEDGTLWMHTHGMLKFGLPELELEDVPSKFKKQGQELLVMAAAELIAGKGLYRSFHGELSLHYNAISVNYEFKQPDDEEHFPDGVFFLRPFVAGQDPDAPEALVKSLSLIESGVADQSAFHAPRGSLTGKARWTSPTGSMDDARRRILDAHRTARESLEDFRKSFQDLAGHLGHVHAVKVGFPVEDGKYEWMWVSLAEWKNGSISGRLENAPVKRTDLHKGCLIIIRESDIFDWVVSSEGKIVKGAFTEGVKDQPLN